MEFSMRRQTKIRIAIVVCCLVVACALLWSRRARVGNTEFRDAAGNVVAVADVKLPEKLVGSGVTFEGCWQLISFKAGFPSEAAKSGRYEGNLDGDHISLDLNPGMADNNIVLGGSRGSDPITGTWYHATIAGGTPMGTFVLKRSAGGN